MNEPSGAGSVFDKLIVPIVVAVAVAILAGGTSPWWWNELFGDDEESAENAAEQTTIGTSAPNTVSTSVLNPATTSSSPGGTDGPSESGCTVTINNPLVSLRDEPDPFALEIRRVPTGTHPVIDWTIASFGSVDQRWLVIQVESDRGWIEHSTIFVAETSGDCTF